MTGQTKVIIALAAVILLGGAVFTTWFLTSKILVKVGADEPPAAPSASSQTQIQQTSPPSTETSAGAANDKISLTLLKGWNFQTIPYILSPNDGKTLFASLSSGGAFYYDAKTQKYLSFLEQGRVNPGQGIAIRSEKGEVYTLLAVNAQAVDATKSFRIALEKDWNVIGNPFNQDISWNPTIELGSGEKLTLEKAIEKNYVSSSYVFSPSSNTYLKVNPGQTVKSAQAVLIKAGGSLNLISAVQ